MYNDVGSYSSLHVVDSIAVGGGKVDGGAACIIVFALFFFLVIFFYLFFFCFFFMLSKGASLNLWICFDKFIDLAESSIFV